MKFNISPISFGNNCLVKSWNIGGIILIHTQQNDWHVWELKYSYEHFRALNECWYLNVINCLFYRGGRRAGIGRKRDYTPVMWNRYFNECHDVEISGNIFRVYCLGNHGPLLVLLHGGGFSALTWALFSVSRIDKLP